MLISSSLSRAARTLAAPIGRDLAAQPVHVGEPRLPHVVRHPVGEQRLPQDLAPPREVAAHDAVRAVRLAHRAAPVARARPEVLGRVLVLHLHEALPIHPREEEADHQVGRRPLDEVLDDRAKARLAPHALERRRLHPDVMAESGPLRNVVWYDAPVLRPRLGLAIFLALAGCGGATAETETTTTPTTQQAALDPEAVREFQAGVRELEHTGRAAERRARDHFETALGIDPGLWEAHYQLGVLDRRGGDLQAAATQFETARTAAPEASEVLVALAEVRHALGDRDAAADLLRSYVSTHPDELPARMSLATILRERGDYDGALEQAREVLIREPSSARALAEVGRVYRAREQYDVAELVIRKALDLGDTAELRNDLGLVQLGRGDTQAAFEEFDRAIALDAGYAPAHLNQGSVLLHAGDYAGAAQHYQAVVDADPENLDARVDLGIALRGQGHNAEARRAYQAVLDAQPTHAGALYNMGVLLADFMDDRPHAREMFQRYLEVAPGNAPQRERAQQYVTDIGAEMAPSAPSSS